jgi:hypothetical protein
VLKEDGKLHFNVWATVEDNPVWRIFGTLVSKFFPNLPLRSESGPFSMADENAVLSLLGRAGFRHCKVESVSKTGNCNTAADAATGFTLGSPLYNFIRKDPSVVERFRGALEQAINLELGSGPVQSSLRALIFSAEK